MRSPSTQRRTFPARRDTRWNVAVPACQIRTCLPPSIQRPFEPISAGSTRVSGVTNFFVSAAWSPPHFGEEDGLAAVFEERRDEAGLGVVAGRRHAAERRAERPSVPRRRVATAPARARPRVVAHAPAAACARVPPSPSRCGRSAGSSCAHPARPSRSRTRARRARRRRPGRAGRGASVRCAHARASADLAPPESRAHGRGGRVRARAQSYDSLSRSSARDVRDFTVPSGRSSACATSCSDSPRK